MSRDNLEMRLFWVLAAIAIVLFATPAYADGIDIGGIFMGVDSALPVGEMIRLICLLMLLNYALNFAVIGIPAVRVGPLELLDRAFQRHVVRIVEHGEGVVRERGRRRHGSR